MATFGSSWDGGKAIASLATGAVATVPGLNYCATANYTTFTVATCRTAHVATSDCYDLQLIFTSHLGASGTAEAVFSNDFEIKCSIECPNGTIVPVFFDTGKRLQLVKPGSTIKTLPVGITLSRGSLFYVRTFCNRLQSDAYAAANGEPGLLTATKTNFPYYHSVRGTSMGYTTRSEGVTFSTSTGIDPFTIDVTDSGTISGSNNVVYAPVAIVGKTVNSFPRSCLVVGDSISAGAGDTWSAINSGRGYSFRACGDTVAVVNCALGGDRASYWVDPNIAVRSHLAGYCTSAIVAMGTNDIINGVSVAATKTAIQTLIAHLEKRVKKVIVCTLLPRATSKDGWMTTEKQNANVTNDFTNRRFEINRWIREELGYPYFDLSKAVEDPAGRGVWNAPGSAVATGTSTSGSGTTLVDSGATWTAHQWVGYNAFFGTQVAQVTSNTSTALTVAAFSPAPSTDAYSIFAGLTADGVHPGVIGHKAMADVVDINQL